MDTRVLAAKDVDEAARILRSGGLVALPTETVYGLGARGLDEECVRRIFAAKGRPQDNPVILHVASVDDAVPLFHFDDDTARARFDTLARAFWPGPLTIVAHKSAVVPDVVTAGLDKVAVRVPAHAAFVDVVRLLGEPIAAPSANASSRPSPTNVTDVLQSLDGKIDAVLDGGPCRFGIESTVVDVTESVPRVLRLGATRVDEIRAFLPDVTTIGRDEKARAASPGLRHKHYAPADKRVVIVDDIASVWGDPDVAVLARAASAFRLPDREHAEILPSDPVLFACALYAALYRLERASTSTIAIERVPDGDAWAAVRDRIERASSG